MWSYASNVITGAIGLKNKNTSRRNRNQSVGSDEDEISGNNTSREEGLECPICWDYFNIVENVPYVLWCGHSLCKNCVLSLQRAIVKFSTLPLQLPLFVSCPWCNLLSFRLVYKGDLKFPRKNFFLLWMVETVNGDRSRSLSSSCNDRQVWSLGSSSSRHTSHVPDNMPAPHNNLQQQQSQGRLFSRYLNRQSIHVSLRKSFALFARLMAKFPLVIIFLLIVLYVVPFTASILVAYVLITVLFALPSLLVLYFAYPSLDWLIREIVN